MPRLDTEFVVYCATCGHELWDHIGIEKVTDKGEVFFSIEPCPECLSEKQKEINFLKKLLEKLQNGS